MLTIVRGSRKLELDMGATRRRRSRLGGEEAQPAAAESLEPDGGTRGPELQVAH
jgi:hypothetical protein